MEPSFEPEFLCSKQPILREANLKAGGDRQRLETALTSMQNNSVLVCRNLELCKLWGASSPSFLLKTIRNREYRGMIDYQDPGKQKILVLHFNIRTKGEHYQECGPTFEWSNELADELKKSLDVAGFKPTIQRQTVRITGNWKHLSVALIVVDQM